MKKIYALLTALLLTIAATAQTLNVQVGSVTYQFPASQCGEMTISDGTITVVTSGGLYYNNGTTENTNYTGDTDNVSSDYYSSPKGIKDRKWNGCGSSSTRRARP